MIVVGLGTKFVPNPAPDALDKPIPALWHRFVNRQHEVPNRLPGPSYGLVERLPGDDQPGPAKPREMSYLSGVPVSSVAANLGSDWLVRQIPAGRYASFTHRGRLDKLHLTLHDIYDVWLAAHHEMLRPGAHIELYDHRFKIDSEESEFDTLVPVR